MSNNPYYIQPQSSIGDIIDPMLKIKAMQQHDATLEQHAATLAEQKRQHTITNFGTETPQPGAITIPQQQINMEQQKLAATTAQIPDHLKVSDPSKIVMAKKALATSFGEGGMKVFEPVFNTMDEVSASSPNSTNWDVYSASKNAWPGHKDDVAANAEKYIMSDAFDKLKPAQKEAFTKMYDAVKYDQTGDVLFDQGVFKNTVASKKMADADSKSALLEVKQGFQNQLLQSKFDNWKEMQDLKFANQKELQDAKYSFLKEMKVAGAGADMLGKKILQGAYMEQLRDVDKNIRELSPYQFTGENPDEEFKAAKNDLAAKRDDIMNDLKELSGVKVSKKEPAAATPMPSMPPAAQHNGRTIRDIATGELYKSNGKSWVAQ